MQVQVSAGEMAFPEFMSSKQEEIHGSDGRNTLLFVHGGDGVLKPRNHSLLFHFLG